MTMTALAPPAPARVADAEPLLRLVLDRVDAPTGKVMYRRALLDFLLWQDATERAMLDKAPVQAFRAHLVARGLAPPSTKNCALAEEAADNGLVAAEIAAGVGRVTGVKSAGTRTGYWLTHAQAQRLLDAPDTGTLKGVRDSAILAVLLGCGLRRAEAAALTFAEDFGPALRDPGTIPW